MRGEVEEGLFKEEVEALRLHFCSGGGAGGEEADGIDGADGEDGGGEVQVLPVLAEGFEEGVGGVVVALAGCSIAVKSELARRKKSSVCVVRAGCRFQAPFTFGSTVAV